MTDACKATVTAFTASEARFRALVQRAADAIAILDADGTIRYQSPAAERILGHTPEALIGTNALALAHPDDLPAVQAALGKVLTAPGATARVALRVCRPDGTYRWVEVTGSNLLDEPTVGGVVVNYRDITERKVAEAALREREEQFRYLFARNPHPMWVYDTETLAFLEVNAAAVAHYGYARDEFLAMTITDIRPPEERSRLLARLPACDAEQLTPGTWHHRTKDGRDIAVEVASRALDYDGRPARLIVAQDVTARRAAEEALQASEARYRRLFAAAERQARELTLLDRVRTALAPLLDERAISRTAAEALAEEFGYGRQGIFLRQGEQLVGETYIGRTYRPFTTPLTAGMMGRVARTRRAELVTDVTRDPDFINGDGTSVSAIAVPLLDGDALLGVLNVESTGAIALGEDDLRLLTALGGSLVLALGRARRHAALRASEANLAEAQRIAHMGSWDYDFATGRLRWSDEVFRIGGYTPRSFTPTPALVEAITHPDDRERIRHTQAVSLERGEGYDVEHRIVRPDGEVRVIHQQAEVARDATGRPIRRMGTVRDVTERNALEARLAHQATHDPLTGLPNRTLLLDRLGQALGHARRDGPPCAVLFLDLDRFKEVNDTLGHAAGDQLLVAVAGRLSAALSEGDTLARLGGDEFAVLLEGVTGTDEVAVVVGRLAAALGATLLLDGHEHTLAASIGIALSTPDHARPEDVLRDADIAMYRVKAMGGMGYALFDPAMQAALASRVGLERDLRGALGQDEFALHYQPIVDLATGRIAKVEALVRWQHPTRGLVSPTAFIPLAEETGLIVPLGRWVLGEACRQARAWRDAGTPVAVAVNLTAREFQRPDLGDEVAAVLAATGLAPEWLRLEITESLAMRDTGATVATLVALRTLGVQIAIDDFGTGYSSLAYLKRLPVDTLKIDKAFVDGLGTDGGDAAIAAAIITLSHTLGLRVIAEGVETAAQVAQLRALGCDFAQGYYFARPLPAAEVAVLLGQGASLGAAPASEPSERGR